jgi:tetratricopeptide (TPR) repeat protein
MKSVDLVIFLFLTAQMAAAQPAVYRQAVESYQSTGTLNAARVLVGEWTRQMFEAAVVVEAGTRDRGRVEAAAMLHLEIALGVALVNPAGALLHIALGERLIGDGLAPAAARAGSAEDDEFIGRWYAVAASAFVAQTDMARARPIVERGRARAPQAAPLRLMSGIVDEMDASRLDPDLAQDSAGSQVAMRTNARIGMEALARLAVAEREYGGAVERDPLLAHAWLRLGRVRFLRGQLTGARDALDRARALARRQGDRVLVQLFLGELAMATGDLDAARSHFGEAGLAAPGVQSAWLALAQLEERAGRLDRARRLVREGLLGSRLSTDPWWEYRNGGFDTEGLAWLRARVRR